MKNLYSRLSELSLVLCTLIWGSTYFIVRDLVQVISPITLVGYRFLLASFLVLLILLFKKKKILDHPKENFYLGFFLFPASNSAFISC